MQLLRSQPLTLSEIVETWLPVRMGAIDDMLWVLDLSDQFGSEVEIQVHIKDGPVFASGLPLLWGPMLAAGYVHARALLEFIGISAKDGALIQIQRRRSSDLAIEHYSVDGKKLEKVTLDEAYSTINMPKTVVDWALVTVIEHANKFFAHVTTGEVLTMAMDHQVRIALRGVSTLVQNHFFAKLGAREATPLEKPPTYSCNTCGGSDNG